MKTLLLYLTAAAAAFAQTYSQPVREVEKPHRAPYQYEIGVNFGTSCTNCESKQFPAIPADKRLVLEHASVSIYTPVDGEYSCRIGPPGGPFLHLDAPRRSINRSVISQPVRMYLDQAPMIACTRNESSTIQWGGGAFLSGYLVDK